MNTESIIVQEQHCACTIHPFKRISWSAIFIGALVITGLGFLLNLFGMAIGLSAVTVNTSGGTALAIGGVIGMIIGLIVSMIAGGYAAGYLGRVYSSHPHNLGLLYGFATWSVALLLSAVVTTQVGHYVTEYAHSITNPTLHTTSQNLDEVRALSVETNTPKANRDQNSTKITASLDSLAYGTFILFIMFFVGAISTCLGAYWAMACCRKAETTRL